MSAAPEGGTDYALALVEEFDALDDHRPWMREGEDGTHCFARWLVETGKVSAPVIATQ